MDDKKKSAGAANAFDRATGAVRRYCADVVSEMKRCTWPTRTELFESTILVVVGMFFLGVFVFLADVIAREFIGLITGTR